MLATRNYGEKYCATKPWLSYTLPSTKRANERPKRPTPLGTSWNFVLKIRAIPEIPKNRYIVLCCQFINLIHPPSL